MKKYDFNKTQFSKGLIDCFADLLVPAPLDSIDNIGIRAKYVYDDRNNLSYSLDVLDVVFQNETFGMNAYIDSFKGTVTVTFSNKLRKEILFIYDYECEALPIFISSPKTVVNTIIACYHSIDTDNVKRAVAEALRNGKAIFKNSVNHDVSLSYENEVMKLEDRGFVIKRHYYIPTEFAQIGYDPILMQFLNINTSKYEILPEKLTDYYTIQTGDINDLILKIEQEFITNKTSIVELLKKLLTNNFVVIEGGAITGQVDNSFTPSIVITSSDGGEAKVVRFALTNDVIEDIEKLKQGIKTIEPDKIYDLAGLVIELIRITGASNTSFFKYQAVLNRALATDSTILLDIMQGSKYTLKIFAKYSMAKIYRDGSVVDSFCLENKAFVKPEQHNLSLSRNR